MGQHLEAPAWDYSAEKRALSASEAEPMPYEMQQQLPTSSVRQRPRRWVLIIIIVVVALAIGLGIGIGVMYASKAHHDNTLESSNAAAATMTPPATATSSAIVITSAPASVPTTLATSSATTSSSTTSTRSGVTSGTTGIANLECNNTSIDNTYTTPSTVSNGGKPHTFTEECYTNYSIGPMVLANGTEVTVWDATVMTTYTYQSCMDNCVAYNAAQGAVVCQAITYYADLSAAIQRNGGNCWLKTSRGARHNGAEGDFADDGLLASAYLIL